MGLYRIVGACSQSKLLLPCNSSGSPSAAHPARFLVWVQIIQIISQKTKAILAWLGMKIRWELSDGPQLVPQPRMV